MSGWPTPEAAKALVDAGAQLVDVRSEAEYAMGHLPGSLLLPMHLIPTGAEAALAKDRPVLVVCQSGARSAMAVQYLQRLGYDARDLGPWSLYRHAF